VIRTDEAGGPAAARAFRSQVWTAVTTQEPRSLLVDLSHITRLDSPMLGAIAAAHRRMHGRGGTCQIVGVRPPVANLLQQSGLASRVPTTVAG